MSGARAVARCDELGVAPYSDTSDGLYRGYLTPAYVRTQQAVGAWMTEAGMTKRVDAAANLVGRYEGAAPDAPALVIGSHLDSVRDAGRYDGPLGVMLGIECVAALNAEGRRLPFAIEVYGFGDEEGSRFPSAMLTSRAVAGILDLATLDMADAEGVTLAEALATVSLDQAKMIDASRARGSILAYLESHIEQGPVLEAEGLAVGAVTGIAAQLRYRVRLNGMAGHAGTTPMPLRRDALAAAAEIVLAAERIARDRGVVATVGKLDVAPGAANVIPGAVELTIDVRALDGDARDSAADAILAAVRETTTARGVDFDVALLQDLAPSPCDQALTGLLAAAMTAEGCADFRLPSGAGHDAMVMAALCPTAMLFVRCRGGVSHNPAEYVDPADAEVALRVMLGFIDRLGATM